MYRATIENCTTERGWARNQAPKIANEHHIPRYLADLQNGNPWLEETIIDNLSEFEPEENSGHDFTSTSKRGQGCGQGGRGGRGRGGRATYQYKTDQPRRRKQSQAVLPCSIPPNQPLALPTGQQAQDVPQCSVPLNQPQALPTRQQAQDVPQCSLQPNQPQAQAPPTAPQLTPIPPVFPISNNFSLAVGQSGQHTNAQLLYGPLVPQTNEDRLLCGRQPTIVMYNRMIKKCYTCDVRYDLNFMSPHQHNIVIRSKTRRSRIIYGRKIKCKDYTNAYYCVDNIACLWKELPGSIKDHIYMGNFYFQILTPGHKAVPEEYGYWKHIVKNWDEVIRKGTLKFN